MKFICSNNTLIRGITAVRNAVGSPISNPIVENIKISCAENRVCFMATNLNQTIFCEEEAEVESPGEILLPSSVITSVVLDLPQDDVTFETKEENVSIKSGKFRAKMKGQSGELFPLFMEVEEGYEITLTGEMIKKIIRKMIYVTSQEKSRYELSGVLFDIKDGILSCVATDGRRLAIYRDMENKIEVPNVHALIPEKTLQEVQRIFSDECDVCIRFNERKVQFKGGDVAIQSNLLMENFPQYEKIIPPEGNIFIRMERDAFASAVKRAANLASVETNMVIVLVESGKLEVFGEREEAGSEGRDQIDAQYEGEKLEIRYNYRFILDLLKVLDEDQVEIELRDERKPGVFRGVGDKVYKYVLMPMRPPDEEAQTS